MSGEGDSINISYKMNTSTPIFDGINRIFKYHILMDYHNNPLMNPPYNLPIISFN
jgi:hypothetical protein